MTGLCHHLPIIMAWAYTQDAISELPEPGYSQTPADSGKLIIPYWVIAPRAPYSRIRDVDETRSGGSDLPIEPVLLSLGWGRP